MDKTVNYNLVKPLDGEFYNVDVPNGNMDTIDAELKKGQDHREDKSNPHQVNAAQVGASNPNLLINGSFQVWQRGTSFSTTGGEIYTADRWFSNYSADTITRIINSSGSAPLYAMRVIGGGSSHCSIAQLLEDADGSYLNKNIPSTLSFWMRAIGAESDISVCSTWTQHITTSWKKYTFTSATPQSGTVSFTSLAVVTSGNGYEIADVKLEIGSVPTLSKQRPYAEELAMCQRYYELLDGYIALAHQGDTELRQTIQFSVRKRIAPTLTIISPNGTVGKVGKYNGATWDDFSYEPTFTTDTNCDKYIMYVKGFSGNPYFMWSMKADAEIY